MKATEVLKRYAAGKRNFQRVNLRGQSFKGQDLSGADFSEADIRSTNFKNANLQGVNFTETKSGLQKRWVIFLLIISLCLSEFSGCCWVYFLILPISLLFDMNNLENFYGGLFYLIILLTFLIIIFQKGIIACTGSFAGAAAIIGAFFGIFLGILSFPGSTVLLYPTFLAFLIAFIFALPGVVTFAGAFAGAIAGAMTITGVATVIFSIAFTTVFIFTESFIEAFIQVFAEPDSIFKDLAVDITLARAIFITSSIFLFYIGWRALKGDKRDTIVRSSAIVFASTGGTSFQCANLTNAVFTRAILKNTDFRNAILTGTNFSNSKKLDLARPGNTYLKNLKLQQWLTATGQDKNFDGQDLQGVNLQGKNLTDASFIGADLNEANLQDADLSRAKLVQTKLDKTDFTGATLTGAFIEDWGITVNTILRGVQCDDIYLRLPTKENPDPHRKPDNRNENFEDGDFEDFIKPIFDTLDLYHNQNIDPRAIALAWKNLAENNPNANLRFASMEVKGEDNLLLKLKTSPNADKSQLNAEYFEEYNRIKVLNEVNKKLLADKNERIQKLENMIELALKTPDYYVKGDLVEGNKSDRSRKIEVEGTVNASDAVGLNTGDISETMANKINQVPDSSNDKEL